MRRSLPLSRRSATKAFHPLGTANSRLARQARAVAPALPLENRRFLQTETLCIFRLQNQPSPSVQCAEKSHRRPTKSPSSKQIQASSCHNHPNPTLLFKSYVAPFSLFNLRKRQVRPEAARKRNTRG